MESPSAIFESLLERRKQGFRLSFAEDVRAAAERFPSDARLQMLLAWVELTRGNLERAVELAEKARSLGYTDPTCIAIAANIAGILGDFSESAKLFEQVAELDPNNFELLRDYSSVLVMLGSTETAQKWAWKGVEHVPANPLLLSMAANIGTLTNNSELFSAAKSALEDQFPEHEATWLLKARVVRREHTDHALSEEYALRAAAANPDAYNSWEHLASVRCAQGKWLEAKQACEVALELCSRAPTALNTMAKIVRHEGDESAAKEFERRAREAVPGLQAMQPVNQAMTLFTSGKKREAAKMLEQMLESPIMPIRNASEQAVLWCAWDESFADLADKTFNRMEAEGRRSSEYWFARTLYLKAKGDIEAAKNAVQEGMKAFPHDSAIRAQATVLEIETADSDAQLDAIINGVMERPFGSATQFLSLVEALLNKKRLDCAERIVTLLERKFSHSSAAYLCRGMLNLQKGEMAEGMRDISRGLRDSGYWLPSRKLSCLTAVMMVPAVLILIVQRLFGIKRKR